VGDWNLGPAGSWFDNALAARARSRAVSKEFGWRVDVRRVSCVSDGMTRRCSGYCNVER